MILHNEFDVKAARWLSNIIAAGKLHGRVDTRSIVDIDADELRNAVQFHAFAGIGGWSLALKMAGWSIDEPVWTGSCPCQPYSVAGRRKGKDDERHLWPAWKFLIEECRPPVIFGEQVASKAGRAWLSDVRADLEALGYRFGAADLCAAGVGAPHIRQRLYFGAVRVADTDTTGRSVERSSRVSQDGDAPQRHDVDGRGEAIGLGHADGGTTGRLGEDPNGSTPTAGLWSNPDWVYCRDNKIRPIEPGTFPLAYGVSSRVVKLRGLGNAIVPQLAAQFVMSFMEAVQGGTE